MRTLPLLGLGVAVTAAVAASPSPTNVPSDALRRYAASAEHELRTDILPFWLAHARDREHGGFYGRVDENLRPDPGAPRGTLLTSRVLWTFSAAARRFPDPAYLDMARWAYRDLMTHGWDPEFGGLFWTVAPDGKPVESLKHVYAQSFGIYGLTEFYRCTHEAAARARAIALYRLIEAKARDRRYGGYFESFNREWTRDDAAQRRILGGKAVKSQNTHIHLLEAYTALFRIWPDPQLHRDLHDLLDLMLTKIIDPATHHLTLYFNEDWSRASDEISFGHDIELSWLIGEAAAEVADPALSERARSVALQMAEVTERQGVDRDGGIFNEANPHGLTDTNKDWWPQAEATVGFLNAYQLSGDARFFYDSRRTWDFVQAKGIDRTHGDWWESVTREGVPRPNRAKITLWKCPYHHSRCCLEIMARIEAIERQPAGLGAP